MSIRLTLSGLLIAVVMLSGCGRSDSTRHLGPTPTTNSVHLSLEYITDENGRRYLCAVYHSYVGVSLSCDWDVTR